jgi:hypothetical protein
MICLQHNGYHVGSMIQGFAHCEKLGGMHVCNSIDIWIWCQVHCHSSFNGVLWSVEP